ncbi:MAG: hypothetical protein QW831_09900, partial [Candidatus Jordarchaeaceae archaeon]
IIFPPRLFVALGERYNDLLIFFINILPILPSSASLGLWFKGLFGWFGYFWLCCLVLAFFPHESLVYLMTFLCNLLHHAQGKDAPKQYKLYHNYDSQNLKHEKETD